MVIKFSLDVSFQWCPLRHLNLSFETQVVIRSLELVQEEARVRISADFHNSLPFVYNQNHCLLLLR
jgi:hypothetical protein